MRNRPDVEATWSDTEVATRWLRLRPKRKTPAGLPEEPSEAELDTIRCLPEKLAEIRRRLSDISWLMSVSDYLELVDWTGRQVVAGKSNMPVHLPPILDRLGIEPTNWLPLVRNFGRLFHRVAGAPRTLDRHARWLRFRPGRAELLGTG